MLASVNKKENQEQWEIELLGKELKVLNIVNLPNESNKTFVVLDSTTNKTYWIKENDITII